MKNLLYFFCTMLCATLVLFACSKDNPKPEPPKIKVTLDAAQYETPACKVLEITPKVTNAAAVEYKWMCGDSTYSTKETFSFITAEAGSKDMRVIVKDANGGTDTVKFTVNVTAGNYKKIQTSVIDIDPAPAHGLNTYLIKNRSKAVLLKEMNEALKEGKTFTEDFVNDMYNRKGLMLGGCGSSIVLGFDHTVVNVPGENDIKLYAEPDEVFIGIVYMAYDKNKNGVPDEDEWYEIKGNLWGSERENRNYSVKYTFKEKEQTPAGFYMTMQFEDSEDRLLELYGYDAFPGINDKGEHFEGWGASPLTFKTKKIAANQDESNYGYIFSDEQKQGEEDTYYFNINDLVDANGNYVKLPGIDFIKIQIGMVIVLGGGAQSCFIRDIFDLHL